MAKRLFATVLLLIALVGVFGCGDDECPTCPQSTQKASVWGRAYINYGELYSFGIISGIDGRIPEVDSVMFNGQSGMMWAGVADLGRGVFTTYSEDPTQHSSGDSLNITFYLPTGTGTCYVKLLDLQTDVPVVMSHLTHSPYDTIPLDQPTTIIWQKVANADWYALEWIYEYDSLGSYASSRFQSFQTDTSFTIPADGLSYNGELEVTVYAMTGPRTDVSEGNVSGSVIKGIISSSASDWLRIFVGTGVIPGSAPRAGTGHETRDLSYEDFLNLTTPY